MTEIKWWTSKFFWRFMIFAVIDFKERTFFWNCRISKSKKNKQKEILFPVN